MSTIATSPSTYWYLTRSTGAVALLLLTGAVALGVIDLRRFNAPGWPRFLIDSLHRNVALLAMVFLAAVLVRVFPAWRPHRERARAALAGAGIFTLFLALWLPSGPLGSEWARRSGTPPSLLGRSHGQHTQGERR